MVQSVTRKEQKAKESRQRFIVIVLKYIQDDDTGVGEMIPIP
jgi:hypothetical protein